ncbi:tight adherence pilus pseudopilin TadF [Yersinia aleksiciae]|uniref:tight adherence pilus pseudopilin TadF n=1 Tax=Yersinia aleksiciae TaxID=263819 RepID=UPI00119CA047|nr:tight adherence pilus pseudopilin TadF [Yersinia aleksiciae]
MYKKINHDSFIVNRSGAVIVELVFVVFIMTLLIKILVAVTTYQSTVGKLDRISYSIAGIVRERGELYGGDNKLAQIQVEELKRLADKMLLNSGIKNNNLAITIETLHFDPTASGVKDIDNQKTLVYSIGACQPIRPLYEMMELSPYANTDRWIPLYQVTLCLPTAPWYNTLFNGGAELSIKSSAVTIER